jgi:hypothetical protein
MLAVRHLPPRHGFSLQYYMIHRLIEITKNTYCNSLPSMCLCLLFKVDVIDVSILEGTYDWHTNNNANNCP